jgi:hypothetical protein
MAAKEDGDDLTAGQTNKAQSGTELECDQFVVGAGNDYIFQVKHKTSSPRVGAIRGQAGLFGVSGEAATTGVIGAGGQTGVFGSGGQIGVEGQSVDTALKGSGGQIGLRARAACLAPWLLRIPSAPVSACVP